MKVQIDKAVIERALDLFELLNETLAGNFIVNRLDIDKFNVVEAELRAALAAQNPMPAFMSELANGDVAYLRAQAVEPEPDNIGGWERLAIALCEEECGEDSVYELVYEGGPIPMPWGDRWLRYEGEAKRLIALVAKHTHPAPAKPLSDEQMTQAFDAFADQYDTHGNEWQDMGADEYFKAGYRAAHGIKETS